MCALTLSLKQQRTKRKAVSLHLDATTPTKPAVLRVNTAAYLCVVLMLYPDLHYGLPSGRCIYNTGTRNTYVCPCRYSVCEASAGRRPSINHYAAYFGLLLSCHFGLRHATAAFRHPRILHPHLYMPQSINSKQVLLFAALFTSAVIRPLA